MISEHFRLATERMILRPFMASAEDALADLQLYADQKGKRRVPEVVTPRQLARYRRDLPYAFEIEEYRLGGFLKATGALAVNIEMSPQSPDPIHYLSVHTMRGFRGQGYGPEAIRAALPFFKAVDGRGIHAQVNQDNGSSLRMMEKLGYKRDDVPRNGFFLFVLK